MAFSWYISTPPSQNKLRIVGIQIPIGREKLWRRVLSMAIECVGMFSRKQSDRSNCISESWITVQQINLQKNILRTKRELRVQHRPSSLRDINCKCQTLIQVQRRRMESLLQLLTQVKQRVPKHLFHTTMLRDVVMKSCWSQDKL